MPVYRFTVTPDPTQRDALVTFADDEEARVQATLVLTDLLTRLGGTSGRLTQRIDVLREDGSILLSFPTRH